ncbi:MAG: hypothetical protein ACRD0P_13900 [Stackebrandtia sp.]
MANNPDPGHITDEMWKLWETCEAAIDGVLLGGIYADKPGYHNTRDANPSDDYSEEKPADQEGPGDKAAALDLTFSEAQGGDYERIQKYTKRVVDAAIAQDERLYKGDTPVIREVIGNFDADARAYDLYTRETDARDDTHLWHIHLSVTRKYLADAEALEGLASVITEG